MRKTLIHWVFVSFFVGLLSLSQVALIGQAAIQELDMISRNHIQGDTQISENHVYLPMILSPNQSFRVNVPYFSGDIRRSRAAIFWFGQVTPTDNYTDVRVAYNDLELDISIAVFDRLLWYDTSPLLVDLTEWDSASFYLSLPGNPNAHLDDYTYRFDAQLNGGEPRQDYQTAYLDSNSGWIPLSVPFTTISGFRWESGMVGGLNNDMNNRGWTMNIKVPFSSLGLSSPPDQGDSWGLALAIHDRDDASGSLIPDKIWPPKMDSIRPESWGQLAFGLPTYNAPNVNPSGEATIRHNLNGAQVVDGHVGGNTTCGQQFWPNFFEGWGDANYAGTTQINIQNQMDLADWPCFSKYYVTFPLDAIPPGKVILSATLTLHQFGNSGQGWEPAPQPSLIQVGLVSEDWDENILNWNNAPYLMENYGGTWVYPLTEFPEGPGIPVEWDVSGAVTSAYTTGERLRLVLYSADGAIHSGKYFYSSDVDEWLAEGRPTLKIEWGNR